MYQQYKNDCTDKPEFNIVDQFNSEDTSSFDAVFNSAYFLFFSHYHDYYYFCILCILYRSDGLPVAQPTTSKH